MPTRISYVADGAEPVTVAEAKSAARYETDDVDAQVGGLIAAAREAAEHITGRRYRPQILREELRDWPAACDAIAVHEATACVVKYWTGSDFATLSSAAYVFAPGGVGGNGTVLAPVSGGSWPTLADRPVGPRVRIELTAGTATPAEVDQQVKLYICASVAAWLNSPEAVTGGQLAPNPMFARLLDAQTLHGF